MTCSAQLQKSKAKSSNWTATFPSEQLTEAQSNLFMKKLVAVAISNITYLRSIFPESAFGDRSLEDLHLKILSENSKCPGACQVINWVRGCFDALDKKYLRQLMIGIYTNPEDPDNVIEAYTFRFSYTKQGSSVTCNGEEIAAAPDNSSNLTRKATVCLLRTIFILTQTLDPLPDNAFMTMKLLYYDDVTPSDYEPPGFKPADSDTFFFNEEPINIKVGDVSTSFHVLKLRVKTDKKQFDVLEEEPIPTEPSVGILQNSHIKNSKLCSVDQKGNTNLNCEFEETNIEKDDKSTISVIPGKNIDNAAEYSKCSDLSSGDVTSQRMKEHKLRCPCDLEENDGLMLLCSLCGFWQHGICYGIVEHNALPNNHVCEKCCDSNDSQKQPTDAYLASLPLIEQQALCVWRRALVACSELRIIQVPILAQLLNISKCVAESIISRLEKEGFVTVGKGRMKGKKLVNKDLIISEAFPKYLSVIKKDNEDMKNDVTVVSQKSENINKLAKDKLKKTSDTNEVDKLSEQTGLLSMDCDTAKEADERCSKKRAIHHSEDEEQTKEFEISNSQEASSDSGSSRRKRRKASMSKNGIQV